jgi:hypothetical protein
MVPSNSNHVLDYQNDIDAFAGHAVVSNHFGVSMVFQWCFNAATIVQYICDIIKKNLIGEIRFKNAQQNVV